MTPRSLSFVSLAVAAGASMLWLALRTGEIPRASETPVVGEPPPAESALRTTDHKSDLSPHRDGSRTAHPPVLQAAQHERQEQAGDLGLTPGMTREEYKRQKAERGGAGKAMNQAFGEESPDPRFTAEMQPKVAGFLQRIYGGSSLQSIECRKSGCFVEFETTEADGVLGLMEQAEKDLGVAGGGALGGAPVKGKPGRYSFEALFLFERG